MRFSLLLSFCSLSAFVAALNPHHKRAPAPDLSRPILPNRPQVRARDRATTARNCEPEIAEHMAARMRRRAEILKRKAGAAGRPFNVARDSSPHYTTIQNTTCVTAPEVAEGPRYISNELVRQDVRESQQGIKALLDFGVMDTCTCTPMNDAFVEIWHANATGQFSGYNAAGDFDGSETWLRGGWFTDANGIVELTTIFPGFYSGRSPHVHLMVHKDWTQFPNGTVMSHSGSLLHIGEAFFRDSWNDEVYQIAPYTSNTNVRMLNVQDPVLVAIASQNGYTPYFVGQFINGHNFDDGLVFYLTIGVDPSASYPITSLNYDG